MVEGRDVIATILEQAEGHYLIVIGASEESLFKNLLMGTASQSRPRKRPR
jgi:hypothetical protein